MSAPTGVLVVDKERGPTSHDVVSRVRRIYRTRSVGHAGTLDPMATGVLVVMLGEATKLSPYLTAADKQYRATVRFGVATDTLDAEGQTTEECPLPPGGLDLAAIEAALARERERTSQAPPGFSAIKLEGKRAHELARRGQDVALPTRPVVVRDLRLSSVKAAEIEIELCVGKGYYVRALARDLGRSVGLPAHLTRLERTKSGPFGIEEAVDLAARPSPAPIPLTEAACRALPFGVLTEAGEVAARQGKRLGVTQFDRAPSSSPAAWLSPTRVLVAIGERAEDETFRVLRGFRQVEASRAENG